MKGKSWCEKLNRMERDRGGLVRAAPGKNRIVFTVQAPDRVAALREIAGAAFAAGCVLDMDGASVLDSGRGIFTAFIEAE